MPFQLLGKLLLLDGTLSSSVIWCPIGGSGGITEGLVCIGHRGGPGDLSFWGVIFALELVEGMSGAFLFAAPKDGGDGG